MASSFGDLLLNMMGNKNPLAAMAAGATGTATPVAGDRTQAGAAGVAGTAAPAAPQEPQAYASPQDLSALYMKLMERAEKTRRIDTGIGLIGASLAQPENRASILQAFTGGGGGVGDPVSAVSNIMRLQQMQSGIESKAALRAQLPLIARKYNLDMATAQYLLDTGGLEAVIKEAEKPNRQVVQNADGTSSIVDLNDNAVVSTFGTTKEPTTTDDQKELAQINSERAAAGTPPLSMEEFLKQKKAGVEVKNILGGESDELVGELVKTTSNRYDTEYDAARGASATLDYVANAREKLDKGIISGSILSPLELQGRKVWADVMGLPDEATANTEAFQASLKEAVLSKIKALGSGTAISDADRRFIESAVGGDIQLTEGAMRQIFDIMERASINTIEQYNKDVDELISSYPEGADQEKVRRLLRKVPLPERPEPTDDSIDSLIEKYGR